MAKKVKKQARRKTRTGRNFASDVLRWKAEMKVWMAQRTMEITSCQRHVRRLRRTIAFAQTTIRESGISIKLEQKQIANARKAIADGRQDIREYTKSAK